MITEFQCQSCNAVIECDGLTPGELIDCPRCGNAVEVPIQRLPPKLAASKPTPKKKSNTFAIVSISLIFAMFIYSVVTGQLSTPPSPSHIAPKSQQYLLRGKVLQIMENGVLLQRPMISTENLASKKVTDFVEAGPEFEPVFVKYGNATIDGQNWFGTVHYDGVAEYKTVLGATKRVKQYRCDD